MGRRLGMLGFWLAWGALVAAQIAVFMQRDALGQASTGALIALLQVIKIGPTLARLNDLGRAPDDALYALIPLLNVGLFFQVAFAGTPREAARERALGVWRGQMLALDAWGAGVRRAMATAGDALLPTLVLGALGSVGVELLIEGIKAAKPSLEGGAVGSGLGWLSVLLGLYTAIQMLNRGRTGWSSWIPAMLFLPTLCLWGWVSFNGTSSQQAGVILAGLPPMASSFTLGAVAGGLLAAVWLLAAVPAARADGVIAALRRVGLSVVVVWGLRQQIDQIGFQVLLFVPGVYFAVSYAFSDILVVLRPDALPFAGSHQHVRGIRSRVFKVLLLWLVLSLALNWIAWTPFLSQTEIVSTLVGAYGTTPWWLHALASFLGVFPSWVCTLALLELFEERERVLEARRAAQAAAAA